ncbi:aminotransferase class IV [Actinokineospora enzanensis]|uniref:aminotransferase class IV n=1 Tax=Actinokineospora enzanensis TaxID=155975 RepID=UPI00036A39D6|nr:aminotransferase class IV [Actinokineospora enzanensis]
MSELDGAPVTVDRLQVLAMYNYGHFTTMRVEDGRVRGLPLHLDRLSHDARAVFDADIDPDRVLAYVRQAVGGRTGAVVVRVTVYDPALDLGHPGAEAHPHILVTTRPAPNLPLSPLTVQLVQHARDSPAVKHVGLFGTVRCRRAAQRAGFDDVVFTGPDGVISEGATWNLGVVDPNGVRWPSAPALPGVTMALLQQVDTIPGVVAPVTVDDLRTAQAVFATNAAFGVRPIALVADETGTARFTGVPAHPTVDALAAAYAEIKGDEL